MIYYLTLASLYHLSRRPFPCFFWIPMTAVVGLQSVVVERRGQLYTAPTRLSGEIQIIKIRRLRINENPPIHPLLPMCGVDPHPDKIVDRVRGPDVPTALSLAETRQIASHWERDEIEPPSRSRLCYHIINVWPYILSATLVSAYSTSGKLIPPIMYSLQARQSSVPTDEEEVGQQLSSLPPSSPPRSAHSKQKKAPSITPRRFTRFFTPRPSGSSANSSRRVLFDVGSATNSRKIGRAHV